MHQVQRTRSSIALPLPLPRGPGKKFLLLSQIFLKIEESPTKFLSQDSSMIARSWIYPLSLWSPQKQNRKTPTLSLGKKRSKYCKKSILVASLRKQEQIPSKKFGTFSCKEWRWSTNLIMKKLTQLRSQSWFSLFILYDVFLFKKSTQFFFCSKIKLLFKTRGSDCQKVCWGSSYARIPTGHVHRARCDAVHARGEGSSSKNGFESKTTGFSLATPLLWCQRKDQPPSSIVSDEPHYERRYDCSSLPNRRKNGQSNFPTKADTRNLTTPCKQCWREKEGFKHDFVMTLCNFVKTRTK